MTSYVGRVARRSAMAFTGALYSFCKVSKNQHGQNHGEHAAQDLRQDVVENRAFCRLQVNLTYELLTYPPLVHPV